MIPTYLANIPGALSVWRLGNAFKTALIDSPEVSRMELAHDYTRAVSWDYSSDHMEIARHKNELALLDGARGDSRFRRALEIGCSEGIFTQQLAERCESLTATDFLQIALDRAQANLLSSNVRFSLLDLRRDSLPEDLDLVCLIHVLDYVRNPLSIRRIREKVVASLRPGGYLLVGTFDPADQDFWWSRFMLRGGRRVVDFFSSHPKLRRLESKILPYPGFEFVDALLQKRE